jgi:hypothetical protein
MESLQTFRVNLSLGAFIKAGTLLGLAQGVVISVLCAFYWLASGRFAFGASAFVVGPIWMGLLGAIFSLAAYPLVRLWCSRFGYPRLWGVFTVVER